MKARQTLPRTQLVSEVIGITSKRFVAKVSAINQAIVRMVDRDYIVPKEGEPDTFNYVA